MIRSMKLCLVMSCLLAVPTWAQPQQDKPQTAIKPNILRNGGFEQGLKNWGYNNPKDSHVPGFISHDKPYEGKNCFVMSEPGHDKFRHFRSELFEVQPDHAYQLQVALAMRDIPKASLQVRVLQYGEMIDGKSEVHGWWHWINPVNII